MIMERLSGTIDVESVENQGTTFYVNIQPEIIEANAMEVPYDGEYQSSGH